jgi:alanine-synthesizing transaminase
VEGTAFNWPDPDHFRIVFLPRADELDTALTRFGEFMQRYRQ